MDRGAGWAYSPWGCKESDMTERLSTAQHICYCQSPTLSILILNKTLRPRSANFGAEIHIQLCLIPEFLTTAHPASYLLIPQYVPGI